MSGPPRPRCIVHERNDCDQCRGAARQLTGDEFDPAYFGAALDRPSSVRPAGRLLENDSSEGVPK